MTAWRKVIGSQVEMPTEFDTMSSDTVIYQHRNIDRISVENTDGTKIGLWQYEEREMNRDEYIQCLTEMTAEEVRKNKEAIDEIIIAMLEG